LQALLSNVDVYSLLCRVTYLDELPNDNRDMRAVVHLEQGIDCIQNTEPPVQVTAIALVLGTTRGIRSINIDNLPQKHEVHSCCTLPVP